MAEKKTPLVTLEELEFEDPIAVPNCLRRPLAVRPMVLMGSGPTNPTKRVTEALCKPIMGIYTQEFHQASLHNNNFKKPPPFVYECRNVCKCLCFAGAVKSKSIKNNNYLPTKLYLQRDLRFIF